MKGSILGRWSGKASLGVMSKWHLKNEESAMKTVGRRTLLERQTAFASALRFVCGQSQEDEEVWHKVDLTIRTGPSMHPNWHLNEQWTSIVKLQEKTTRMFHIHFKDPQPLRVIDTPMYAVGNRLMSNMWPLPSGWSAALAWMASPHLAPTECGLDPVQLRTTETSWGSWASLPPTAQTFRKRLGTVKKTSQGTWNINWAWANGQQLYVPVPFY